VKIQIEQIHSDLAWSLQLDRPDQITLTKLNRILVMGWSAGGIVAAWTLTHDVNRIVNSGIVMDAELTGPSEPATRTEHSIFTTAQLAAQVSVLQLLIWGMGNSGAIGIQSAGEWFRNAGRQLVRVDPLPYTHDWLGTSTEATVRADVTTFLKNWTVGTTAPIIMNTDNATTVAHLLSNRNVHGATYDQSLGIVQMSLEGSEPVGIVNLVLPRSSIRGSLVILLDGNTGDFSCFQDESNYYIFYSYPPGAHTSSVGGQDAIPEFVTILPALISLFLLIAVLTRKPCPLNKGTQRSEFDANRPNAELSCNR